MIDFDAVETRNDNHVGGWVTTTDATKLWVDVHGRGRPIVLVHGWTMSSAFWHRQLALATEFQIITVDLRGHGRSQSVLRGHTMARYARDLRSVITALDLQDIILAGWSMGGSVVLDYWQQFGADRVFGLGIIESAPAPMSSAPWNTHYCRENNTNAKEMDVAAIRQDRAQYAENFVNSMFLSGDAPSHSFKWMVDEHMKTSDETAISIFEDYVHRDYSPVLPTIAVPSLVMYGRSKNMCYGPSTGRFVAGSIPDSRFVILEKSGHLPFYEEAGLFNEELKHFVNKL